MRREAQQVEPACREVDLDVSDGLDRVAVRDCAMLAGERGDLAYRLQRADLIVRPHHRNHCGSRIDSAGEGG